MWGVERAMAAEGWERHMPWRVAMTEQGAGLGRLAESAQGESEYDGAQKSVEAELQVLSRCDGAIRRSTRVGWRGGSTQARPW